MSSPHSPFTPTNASIGSDTARAAAGFYLIDDAGGRFIVDRDLGIVSLADEALLAREHNSVHAARLRVIESSGASYELDLKLRLTGRVPQVVGAEDFGAIAVMADGVSEQIASGVVITTQRDVRAAQVHFTSWTRYASALGACGKADLIRTRRAFISAELPVTTAPLSAVLSLSEPPPAVGARAPWSL